VERYRNVQRCNPEHHRKRRKLAGHLGQQHIRRGCQSRCLQRLLRCHLKTLILERAGDKEFEREPTLGAADFRHAFRTKGCCCLVEVKSLATCVDFAKVDVIVAGVSRDANEGGRAANGCYCAGENYQQKDDDSFGEHLGNYSKGC
jgi:hypothetical protein